VSSGSAKPARPGRHGHAKKVWWKRPLTWVGGILTITITAVATAFGTGLGQELSNTVTGTSGSGTPLTTSSASASASSTHASPSTIPTGSNTGRASQPPLPLIIEDVSVGFWKDESFMSPRKVVFTGPDLAKFNKSREANAPQWPVPAGDIIENEELITITVAGNSPTPITINDMEIVRQCQTPLQGGTLFYSPVAGGGAYPTASIYFNLDQPLSVGQYVPGPTGGPLGGNYFARQVVTLRRYEPQTFAVFVTTTRQYCSFTFRISVATVNGVKYETVANNGQPFAITADGEQLSSADPVLVNVANPDRVSFSSYSVVYAGGLADEQHNWSFIRVNPITYPGMGDPTAFPPGRR
jgi:hypothetical protein